MSGRQPKGKVTPIEDYAVLGDLRTAALVSRAGSIDWLCLPRFDSHACFAALLGTPDNGRWLIGPVDPDARTTRRYLNDSFVLETTHETSSGVVRVIDVMPLADGRADVLRRIEGVSGTVRMRHEWVVRFGYGKTKPFVSRHTEEREAGIDQIITAMAGPDMIVLRHSSSGAGHLLSRICRSGIINAGDGTHEHPTQALLDAFTIRERKGTLGGLKVAIIGDLLHSRVLRSNVQLLTKMGAEVWVCGPPTLIPAGSGAWPGLQTGLLIGLCVVATSFGINYLFANRPAAALSIDGGYHVAQFAAFGLVLGLWPG